MTLKTRILLSLTAAALTATMTACANNNNDPVPSANPSDNNVITNEPNDDTLSVDAYKSQVEEVNTLLENTRKLVKAAGTADAPADVKATLENTKAALQDFMSVSAPQQCEEVYRKYIAICGVYIGAIDSALTAVDETVESAKLDAVAKSSELLTQAYDVFKEGKALLGNNPAC